MQYEAKKYPYKQLYILEDERKGEELKQLLMSKP